MEKKRRRKRRKLFREGKCIFCRGEEKEEKEENIWRRKKYLLRRKIKTEKEKNTRPNINCA